MHGVVIELVQNPKLQVSWCHRSESRVTRNECIDKAAVNSQRVSVAAIVSLPQHLSVPKPCSVV